ncbi:hypothetical protein [Novosphingobium sp. PY1]|uniref:hypothetical protein n=1 Tax=Novosphingobium sp. PY1 TaxID=1882221 RepID=UPI001F5D5F7D|nr:hypothetical protein [Novosphingobium sp. PY1]
MKKRNQLFPKRIVNVGRLIALMEGTRNIVTALVVHTIEAKCGVTGSARRIGGQAHWQIANGETWLHRARQAYWMKSWTGSLLFKR